MYDIFNLMTHDFSHNPIKIKYIDLTSGKVTKTHVFIGNVPPDILKELSKLERAYNRTGKNYKSSKLKKFYGKNWQYRLGVHITSKKGGADTDSSPVDVDVTGLINSAFGGDEAVDAIEYQIPNADELTEFDIGNELLDDSVLSSDAITIDDADMLDTSNIISSPNTPFVDKGDDTLIDEPINSHLSYHVEKTYGDQDIDTDRILLKLQW